MTPVLPNSGEAAELKQPAFGDERIMLFPTRSRKGAHRLERQVFAEQGFTHIYDDSGKDWVTWSGEWTALEVLGHFDSPDAAKQFLIEADAPRPNTRGGG